MAVSDDFDALIRRMDGGFIREYSYMVNKSLVAKALKTADPEIQAKIFDNIPAADADAVKDEMANLGSIPLEQVEAAQRELLSMAQGYV